MDLDRRGRACWNDKVASIFFVFCLLLIVFGCSESKPLPAQPAEIENRELTSEVRNWDVHFETVEALKPPFRYLNGENDEYYSILEALGGGVAAADFDNDSKWDLVLTGGGGLYSNQIITSAENAFYRNVGNWQLEAIPSSLPVSPHFSNGVATGDFDDDGFADILITGYGGLQLLRNLGDGTFHDVTEVSGLVDTSWSTSAAWADLNGDHVLDLYVAHYVDWSFQNNPLCVNQLENIRDTCAPRTFKPLDDEVFIGLGDGQFVSARESLGFSTGGSGLGVLVLDFDGDRDVDVYVANDGLPNFFYENTGGKFEDVSISSGADRNERGMPDGSMGLESGDFNDDLLPDIWVTNYENESMALYSSLSPAFYQHASHPTGVSGIGSSYVGWGIQLSDFDADGDEDVMIATGHAQRHPLANTRFQRPVLLKNDDNHFSNVASGVGAYFQADHLGRGLASCDFDNNGTIDTAVSQLHEPAALLRCQNGNSANWVGIRLISRSGTRDPVGASVKATTFGKKRMRMVKGGGSYLSTSDRRIVFCVPASESSLTVEVAWPSGANQVIEQLATGGYHTIVESYDPLRIPE